MSCYHPLVRVPDVYYDNQGIQRIAVDDNGQMKYRIRKLLPQEKEFMIDHKTGWMIKESMVIPCGHCVGCKLDYSRQWADRMLCELQSAHGKGVFVTLTYSPENVPFSWYEDNQGCLHRSYTLKKEDLQAFNKSLRRVFDDSGDYPDFPVCKVRFYAAGEYGEMTLRPHYHIIYFGIDLNDLMAVPATNELGQIVKNELGDIYYRSEILEKKWNKGLVSVANVTWKTCAYVARYVTKKWSSGYSKDDCYDFFKVEKEFSLMSRKPGIGAEFFEKWHEDHDFSMLDLKSMSFGDENGVKQISIPKYFRNKYRDSRDEGMQEAYEKYVKRAIEINESRIVLQLEKTDKEYLEVLADSERRHKNGVKKLQRNKV